MTPTTPFVQIVPAAAAVSGPSSAADEALVACARKAASGDAAATVALLRSVRPKVVAVVRRILGASPPDVEDAVQQSLVGFVHALPAFRGDANPSAYAKTIALRTALALRRRMVSGQRHTDADCDTSALPSRAPAPNDDAAAERRRALLRRLLDEIPAPQAEALAMRIMLGASLEEIAAQGGVTLNTVRSRLRLGKEALRRKIEAAPGLRDALELDE